MVEYWELQMHLPNPENERVINEFLLSKKKLNRNPNLIANYRRVLQCFFEERIESFTAITKEDIDKWNEGKPPYREKMLGIFYNYCKGEGYVEKSPLSKPIGDITVVKKRLANPENQKIVNEYLLNMKGLGRRDETILGHRKALQHFFMEREASFRSLTSSDMTTWIGRQEKTWRRETIYIRLCIIRTFYNYCMDAGLLQKNPIIPFTIERERKKEWSRPLLLMKQAKCWKVKAPLANLENMNIINEYLLSLRVSNYSMATIETYRKNLKLFFRNRKDAFTSLESKDLQDWLKQKQKGWKESTLHTHLSILNAFLDYCVEEGHMEKNIIKKRWFPLLPQPVPKYLVKAEIANVRQQAEQKPLRSRAILEFLLTSGCRVGELVGIDQQDVDLENRTARVTGKGRKIREVHFSEKCALLLVRYLETRNDDGQALFVTPWGARLREGSIQRLMRDIGVIAELPSSLHPHRFRHTFATELLAKGADLEYIRDELGHSNLQTTQIYARLPKQEIISMYRKYMG